MDSIKLFPSKLSGTITIPSSKSQCHRALIAGALADGASHIKNVTYSDDIKATVNALRCFGVIIEKIEDSIIVKGQGKVDRTCQLIDCNESGSTLRFLIPLALTSGYEYTFNGKGRLPERPIGPYYEIMEKQGINYTNNYGRLPLTVKGKLRGDNYHIPGDISSQFITGLMFALPLLEGDSKIIATTPLESRGYVDMTMDTLKKFSIEVDDVDGSYLIKGRQKYMNSDVMVEGDFSQAAFFLCSGVLGGDITVSGVNYNSLQPDKAIIDIIKAAGGKIDIISDGITARESELKGNEIDASNCPDLVPILAVMGAVSNGTTVIKGAKRLKIKESDRLKAISTELNKLGAYITQTDDGLIIKGVSKLSGGVVDSWGDHRIAMALAVASIKCSEPLVIQNSSVVKKSYPGFFEDFIMLGGKIYEQRME